MIDTRASRVLVCSLVALVACSSDDSLSGNRRDVAEVTQSAETSVSVDVALDTGAPDTDAPDTVEDTAPETIEETASETIEDTFVAEVEPETIADTTPIDVGPDLLDSGESCSDNAECESGMCAPGRFGRTCVDPCGDDGACPDGFFCAPFEGATDTIDACLPIDTTVCAPCRDDDDCAPNGEPTTCVQLGGFDPETEQTDESVGSFCVLACEFGCADDETCEDGYCRPSDGESVLACDCSPWATEAAAETDCAQDNTSGRCQGTRACGDAGLSDCDARVPAAEVCDAVDNDCDGSSNEDTCDDGNACTTDACDPLTGCKHTPASGGTCEDTNACTGTGTCAGGICIGGAPVDCDDENPCTSLACDPATGCTYASLTGSCDDGDPCTTGTTCNGGSCVAAGVLDCDDGNPCTADQCVPGFGCVHQPTGGSCDDGDPCTFDEVCVGTTCTPQTDLDCADINPCTLDTCTPERQCAHVATGLSCVDDPGYQDFCEKVGAASVTEPNDSFAQAVLTASAQTFTTSVSPLDDVDRYVMWVCSERIIRVTLDNEPATSSLVDYSVSFHPTVDSTRHTLEDTNGGNGATHIAFNAYANAAGPVYVSVSDWLDNDADPSKPYRLTLQALPVPDADLEPNDRRENATALASGESVTAFIASLDDHDWYAIEVPGEHVLRARLTATATDGTETDFSMELFSQDGDHVLTWDDTNGGNGPTYLDVNHYVGEPTTMYVDVHDWLDDNFDYAKSYTLVLEVLAVPDAALEPNGNGTFAANSALATPITPNVAQAACIASVEDEDWFKFEVAAESVINVSVDNVPAISSPVDYEVIVYGPSGNELNLLRDTEGGNGTTVVSYNSYAFGPGTYYVLVHDWLDDEWDIQRCYDVTVQILPVPDAADEPNDISAQAVQLVTGEQHMAYIASLEDVDWYTFAVPGERIIEARLQALVGPFDPELVVSAPAEQITVRDTDGSDNPTSIIGAAYTASAGDHTLQVHDWLDDQWGYAQSYTVEVRLYDVPDAALEPNGTRATASPIAVGGTVSAYHASDIDFDYWSFVAPASGQVTIQLRTLVPTATDYELALRDANGSIVDDEVDQNGANQATQLTINRTVSAGATYYISVSDFGDDSYDLAIPYELTLSP